MRERGRLADAREREVTGGGTPVANPADWRRAGGIVLAAVVVRFAIFLAFPSVFAFERTGVIHGSEAYDTYARNLVATGTYGLQRDVPDAVLPPLYSAVVASVYALVGRHSIAIVALQVALDAVSIVTLVAIGGRLLPHGSPAALLAGLFFGLYPYLVFQSLVLSDTTFFVFLLHLFVLSAVLLWDRPARPGPPWALASLSGLALGCAILTRPIVLPLAGLVGVWFLFRHDARETLARLLPLAVAALAIVAPWMGRNYFALHAVVPVSTSMGSNFWQGNNASTLPLLRAGYDVQWAAPDPVPGDPGATARDAALLGLALRYLYEHPDQIPELLWTKFRVQWSVDVAPRRNPVAGAELAAAGREAGLETVGPAPPDAVARYGAPLFDRIGRTVHRLYWGSLLVLGVAGMALAIRAWRRLALLYFVQASMTAVYVIFHPSTRYRAATDPLFFLFSAFALVWAWRRVRARLGLDAVA